MEDEFTLQLIRIEAKIDLLAHIFKWAVACGAGCAVYSTYLLNTLTGGMPVHVTAGIFSMIIAAVFAVGITRREKRILYRRKAKPEDVESLRYPT